MTQAMRKDRRMSTDQQSFKLLIQSFISPRGRDVATIHSVVTDFPTYDDAQRAAAIVDQLPAETYPHVKVVRLYPLKKHSREAD
jgi:hypothetical protein